MESMSEFMRYYPQRDISDSFSYGSRVDITILQLVTGGLIIRLEIVLQQTFTKEGNSSLTLYLISSVHLDLVMDLRIGIKNYTTVCRIGFPLSKLE